MGAGIWHGAIAKRKKSEHVTLAWGLGGRKKKEGPCGVCGEGREDLEEGLGGALCARRDEVIKRWMEEGPDMGKWRDCLVILSLVVIK